MSITSRRQHRGFTLIELMVVIGVIAVLVALTLVVGGTVVDGGKRRVTEDNIRILDTSLSAFMAATDGVPKPLVTDPTDPNVLWPLMDGRDMTNTVAGNTPPGNQMLNSVGLYILQAQGVPQAKAAIDGINAKYLSRMDIDGDGGSGGPQRELITVLDGWGRPIRFVHPTFDGSLSDAQGTASPSVSAARPLTDILGPAPTGKSYGIADVRRNSVTTAAPPLALAQQYGDADGGTCTGTRPYFYSAGPDGQVGVRREGFNMTSKIEEDFNADNVYTTRPTLPG